MVRNVLIRQIQLGREHLLNIGLERIRALPKHFFFVSEFNGCQVCDSGPYRQNGSVSFSKRFHVLRNLRTWTNQAHLTYENIPELGQFIEFGHSKESSHSRDSTIAGDSNQAPAVIRYHRAKFPNPESTEM